MGWDVVIGLRIYNLMATCVCTISHQIYLIPMVVLWGYETCGRMYITSKRRVKFKKNCDIYIYTLPFALLLKKTQKTKAQSNLVAMPEG